MDKWNDISYQTMQNAEIRNGNLAVTFANGDVAKVDLHTILSFASQAELSKLKTENVQWTSYEIKIDMESQTRTIPWDKIRVLTDKEFSKSLAQKAEEQAKLIGVKIKRLREKQGLKSNELAERAGITAQTVSRIEKGHQDVSFSTLRKLLASMAYSLGDLADEEIELENEKIEQKTFPSLLKRLSKIGIDPTFVTKNLIPRTLQRELDNHQEDQPDLLLDEAASYLSNIYGWPVKDIWGKSELAFDETKISAALFKKGGRSNYNQIKAYVPYAHYLAKTVIRANKKNAVMSLPKDADEFKQVLNRKYGGLALESILNYAWDMGIYILPLNDSGIFHGAAWNINGKHVIVLKQRVTAHAKWLFDLLHELYHILVHLKNSPDDVIIELSEISPMSKEEDERELEANSFASQIIFNENPEKMAQEAVTLAKGKIEFLKSAVEKIAKQYNVREDCLANYLAYRLAYQGNQWWSTADTLQVKEPEPFIVVRDILMKIKFN
jgi:transcriptional regulator with XRE-family HTH domain/Zn-dependent peptidase ImmA (M78 family)